MNSLLYFTNGFDHKKSILIFLNTAVVKLILVNIINFNILKLDIINSQKLLGRSSLPLRARSLSPLQVSLLYALLRIYDKSQYTKSKIQNGCLDRYFLRQIFSFSSRHFSEFLLNFELLLPWQGHYDSQTKRAGKFLP